MSFLDECNFFEKNKSGSPNPKIILEMCVSEPKITAELLGNLTVIEGNILLGEINKLNGWLKMDFQNYLLSYLYYKK